MHKMFNNVTHHKMELCMDSRKVWQWVMCSTHLFLLVIKKKKKLDVMTVILRDTLTSGEVRKVKQVKWVEYDDTMVTGCDVLENNTRTLDVEMKVRFQQLKSSPFAPFKNVSGCSK